MAFSPERVDPGNKIYKTKREHAQGRRRQHAELFGGRTGALLANHRQAGAGLVPRGGRDGQATREHLPRRKHRLGERGCDHEVASWASIHSEVIRAAATKPFRVHALLPRPWLGWLHCIPIDPLYLSWKLRTLQYQARFIDLADSINSGMPAYVIERASTALNDHSKAMRGSKVLIYGVAYKKDVSDVRESPAFAVIHGMMQRGANVAIMDPFVTEVDEEGVVLKATDPKSSFAEYDLVVIVTDHSALERERLLREAKLVLDTRDALRGIAGDHDKVYGL